MNNLYAKKSLGQNFLKSKKAITALIEAPQTSSADLVIEIGPGKGALTKPLLATGARVIAFELDPRMVELLEDECREECARGQLTLVHKDIIDVDLAEYTHNEPYKVVANIPYYITNLIIRKFLESPLQPTDMSLLVQKEVAERIVARDGKESLLSLSVKLFAIPKYIMKVGRNYFSPRPKVDSAIIHIKDIGRTHLSPQDEVAFFELLHIGFAHKRKQLMKNLSSQYPKEKLKEVFETLNINEKIRAEDIPLETWLALFEILKYR